MRTTISSVFFYLILTSPAFSQSPLLKADSLLQIYQFEEAISFLDAYMTEHPNRKYDRAESLLLKAIAFYHLAKLDDALTYNNQSQTVFMEIGADDFPKNYLLNSKIELQKGDIEAALTTIREAQEFPVNSILLVELIFQEGLIHKAKGDPETAMEAFNDVLAIMDIEGVEYPVLRANTHWTLANIHLNNKFEKEADDQLSQLMALLIQEKESREWIMRELSQKVGAQPAHFWLWPLSLLSED